MKSLAAIPALLFSLSLAFSQTTQTTPKSTDLLSTDAWSKVEALKGGSDLRVYKTGSAIPIAAEFADLNEDNLIVVIKNTETAIPKIEIDRIDARPKGGSRMHTETTQSEKAPDQTSPNPREQTHPSTDSNASVQFGSKGDFQTVYRKTASAPKPPPSS
jgi:hypothetical protein